MVAARLFSATVEGADAVLAALIALECLSCAEVLETPTRSPVCERCWRNLRRVTPPLCAGCGDALPPGGLHDACPLAGSPIAAARTLGPYEGVLRDLVHAIKFERRRSLVRPLVRSLAPLVETVMADADALIPVPLHPWRHWTRGFNQADDIARALAAGRTPVLHALRRVRSTPPQSSLDADARHDNIRGAFAVAGWTAHRTRRLKARLAGATLVLVDDVMTTGATLEEAAKVLLAAGAREVRAVTLARVEQRRQ